MRVVNIDDVPLEEIQHVREGVFRTRRLLLGEPDTPGNFALQLVSIPQTYYSPRHRHNFDQVRCQIEGEFDFSADGKMPPGSIGYFPEGAYYGPQSSDASTLALVLQFGGASGSGYISTEQYEEARKELAKAGSFAKGVYTRVEKDGNKINKDAYEAVWEQVNGRTLVYPKPRYARPVFMQPDNFVWVPLKGHDGVSCKTLGVFSECRTRIIQYRLEAGSGLPLEDNALYFVEEGSGSVEGMDFGKYTALHLEQGESAAVTAKSGTELLQLGLPYFT